MDNFRHRALELIREARDFSGLRHPYKGPQENVYRTRHVAKCDAFIADAIKADQLEIKFERTAEEAYIALLKGNLEDAKATAKSCRKQLRKALANSFEDWHE